MINNYQDLIYKSIQYSLLNVKSFMFSLVVKMITFYTSILKVSMALIEKNLLK